MSIVYLDEELPIIDFQTVISDEDIEQEFDIKDKKIGLNIYSSEDIYNVGPLLFVSQYFPDGKPSSAACRDDTGYY